MADTQEEGLPSQEDNEEICERTLSATRDLSGQFTQMNAKSAAVRGTGVQANLVCFKRSGYHNSVLKKWRSALAQPYFARARFKFGDGRPGEVRYAAGSPVGIAGGPGKFADFLLQAEIPALLRKGALRAAGWDTDFRP